MSAFADTSFLFAFYFPRDVSERAVAKVENSSLPLRISTLVRYEFQQAVWFEVWRRTNGPSRGLNEIDAQTGLAAFDLDLEHGLWDMALPDWETVIAQAARISRNAFSAIKQLLGTTSKASDFTNITRRNGCDL